MQALFYVRILIIYIKVNINRVWIDQITRVTLFIDSFLLSIEMRFQEIEKLSSGYQ